MMKDSVMESETGRDKMIHEKIHIVCWRYKNEMGFSSFHAQHYITKQIAKDKMKQLLEDRKHVHPKDILYRCIIFKFNPPNAQDDGAGASPAPVHRLVGPRQVGP